MSDNWRKAGLAGAAIGVIAAGAAAGVAVERLTVGRGVRMKARLVLDAAGDYGSLRGTPGTVLAEDGTELYYETEETGPGAPGGASGATPVAGEEDGSAAVGTGAGAGTVGSGEAVDPAAGRPPRKRRFRRGRPAAAETAARAPLTVVFCHGYCLSQDAWHFQRAALRGVVRAVYWDQRSHGRSARGAAQAAGESLTIDQLGRDLKAVIDRAAPEGPLVLVGHSMGGMTIMALGAQFPELVRDRVVGVAFVGTSSGRLGEVTYGLPAAGMGLVRRVLPGVLRALGSEVDLVERGRRATADLFAGAVKRYSFGTKDVDPGVARFAERLIEATPIDVVAEFYPAFEPHDKTAELAVFAGLPSLVMAGEKDLITPAAHGEAIAAELPGTDLAVLPDTGHLLMLERPEEVTERLAALLERAGAGPAAANVGAYGSTAHQAP
ncbi:alpha/beta hydrolase [Streptomyces sp. NPDC097619]|uniref:alpha/beta fold hydrolase n=1 Tax=Streptomyces sp. NPDC097619 TaxID=3157228 RepID=UPI0033237FD1